MDAGTFETWLRAAATLTPAQRRQAFQSLALSEAALLDAGEPVQREPAAIERTTDAVSRVMPDDPAGVAALGQRKVNALGCPHCAYREVVRRGTASALPRS